jgi:hypothetical protein
MDTDSERCVVRLSGAVVKSKAVPGFEEIPADNLGQNSFIGKVTQGGETTSALAH